MKIKDIFPYIVLFLSCGNLITPIYSNGVNLLFTNKLKYSIYKSDAEVW